MKPEAQRIAIAEACGWTDMACTDKSGYYHGCLMGNHDYGHLQPVPDYLNDLNAMHEAEKAMIRGHFDMEYRETLERVCNEGYAVIIYATAAQRAEAFLRTLGLWVEEAVADNKQAGNYR